MARLLDISFLSISGLVSKAIRATLDQHYQILGFQILSNNNLKLFALCLLNDYNKMTQILRKYPNMFLISQPLFHEISLFGIFPKETKHCQRSICTPMFTEQHYLQKPRHLNSLSDVNE